MRHKGFRSLLGTPLALVIFAALAAFAASAAWRSFSEYRAAVIARNAAEERASQLESEKARLSQKAGIGDARRTEEEIREKLRMSKPGEEIIIIVDDSAQKNQEEILPKENWMDSVLKWVGLKK
jgi:cell division protein FtsL